MTNELLRHLLSTIQYRFERSVFDATEDFATYSIGEGRRTPQEIVDHMAHVRCATVVFIETETFEHNTPQGERWAHSLDAFRDAILQRDRALHTRSLDILYVKDLSRARSSRQLSLPV